MTGIVIIPSGIEPTLQAAVASAGPVATAVDAKTNSFRVGPPKHTFTCVTHELVCMHMHMRAHTHTHTHHTSCSSILVECTAHQGVLAMMSTMPC